MIRKIQGIAFDVASPSFYRAVLPNYAMSTINISYIEPGWCLFLEHNGQVSTRCFPSRDDAVAMVAQAFKNEGVL